MKRSQRITFAVSDQVFQAYHALSEIEKKEVNSEVEIAVGRKYHNSLFKPKEWVGRDEE